MELIVDILFIVLLSYILYFLYLKIKINKEKLKYYERQNKDIDNVGKK